MKMRMNLKEFKRITFPRALLLALMALFLFQAVSGCDYGRMSNDEAIDAYGLPMPEMPRETIPFEGGREVLLAGSGGPIENPLPKTPQILKAGAVAYGYFCVHCHGPQGEGRGTVGQSFAPLPTNLRSPYVQNQSDRDLFLRTSLGFKRHPPLLHTVADRNMWEIITYLRSLSPESGPVGDSRSPKGEARPE